MLNLSRIFKIVVDLPQQLGRPLSKTYIPELDGLRFVALIVVLFWHASIRAARYHENNANTNGFYFSFPHGEIGVLLFFFISGYVVAQPFLSKPSDEWNIKYFYICRFIRIYPPYLISISLCFFLLQVIGHVPSNANAWNNNSISLVSSYFASAFYLHSFIFDVPSRLNPPIWSLELEIIFYAIAPLLIFFYIKVRSKQKRVITLCIAILGLFLLTTYFSFHHQIDGRFRWGLLVHGYLFLLGILACDVAPDFFKKYKNKSFSFDIFSLLGFGCFLIIGLYMTQYDARLPTGWLTFLMQLSITLSIIFVFLGSLYGTASSYFLSLSWVRLIGTMCYSIYLTHIVTMQATAEIANKIFSIDDPLLVWAVWIFILIPASIIVGAIFYIVVEKPFYNAARKVRISGAN